MCVDCNTQAFIGKWKFKNSTNPSQYPDQKVFKITKEPYIYIEWSDAANQNTYKCQLHCAKCVNGQCQVLSGGVAAEGHLHEIKVELVVGNAKALSGNVFPKGCGIGEPIHHLTGTWGADEHGEDWLESDPAEPAAVSV